MTKLTVETPNPARQAQEPTPRKKAYASMPGGEVFVQGLPGYAIGKMLAQHPEERVLMSLGKGYHEVGRVKSLSEGVALAAASVQLYRSNAAGEDVPQHARKRLDAARSESKAKSVPAPSSKAWNLAM